MSHKNKNKFHGNKMNPDNVKPQDVEESSQEVPVEEVTPEEVEPEENQAQEEAKEVCDDAEKKIAELQEQLDKEKKEYLFLMAEFDNFRKRTLKEKVKSSRMPVKMF